MRSAEIVIVAALFVGLAIGTWFERGRVGGTHHMRCQRDNARRACDRARAERDEARELLRQRFAGSHRPAAPSAPTPTARLQLVTDAVEA